MVYTIPHRARSLIKISLTPRLGGRLISEIEKWVNHSGLEWTCNRLKAYHIAAVQFKAGNSQLAKAALGEVGIAFEGPKGLKGPFGFLIYNYYRAQHPQLLRKWHAMLRIYTMLRMDSKTEKQIVKAKASICYKRSELEESTLIKLVPMFEKFVRKQKISVPTIGNPSLNHMNPFSATHRNLMISSKDFDEVGCKAYAKHTASLLSSTWIPGALQGVNPCEELRSALVAGGSENTEAGHISFLQEGGCKARVIAVPNAWCQWLMEPLHRALSLIIKDDKHSAVFNQNAGAYYLSGMLGDNRKMFCFDLSSATDIFPLPLQEAFLRGIGLETYADAIHSISNGKWLLDGESVQYTAGQPMGLYGSFPLFHLTHTYFLVFLQKYINRSNKGHVCDFLVLGDDVIIYGEALAILYEEMLISLGVPISPVKSITSSRLGQFAGFTGLKTTHGIFSYRPFKWNMTKKRKNITNSCYSFGSVVKKLGSKWKPIYDDLSRTWHLRQPDLSPIVNCFDLLQEQPDWGIDSYFLGSLVNRIAYYLPNTLNSEFDRLWFTQVYYLLDQQVVTNANIGLDLTSDPRAGGYCIQELDRHNRAPGALVKPKLKQTNEFAEVYLDPVVRQSSLSRSTNTRLSDDDTVFEESRCF